jgi:hypothetical protein
VCWFVVVRFPTRVPSIVPTGEPTIVPPTANPTFWPTFGPSGVPTYRPTMAPTYFPSRLPSRVPTVWPSKRPSSSPSGRPTYTPTAEPTSTPKYPRLSGVLAQGRATWIQLTASMTLPGYLYCAAFSSATTVSDPSGAAVKQQAVYGNEIVAASDGSYQGYYNITGLTPLTAFRVYCYTEDYSKPAQTLPDSLVALTRVRVNTTCCYSVKVPSLPASLYESTMSSTFTYTAPVAGVSLVVNVSSCGNVSVANCRSDYLVSVANGGGYSSLGAACAAVVTPGGFRVSPSTVLNMTQKTSAAVKAFAANPGCYLLTYTVSGRLAATFDTPTPQLLYVYTTGSAVSGPSLLSAQFSDPGSQLLIDFDGATNLGGLAGTFVCSRLVVFRGSATTDCFWGTASRLIASLNSSSVIVPGQNVTLRAGVLRAACALSAARCASWPTSTRQAITVLPPAGPTAPVPNLVYTTSIGYCSDLVVDASTSGGGGGRAMFYTWAVREKRPSWTKYYSSANVTAYLHLVNYNASGSYPANAYGVSKLTIPSRFLFKGASYRVTLSLSNYLGASTDSSAAFIAVIAARAPPVLRVVPRSLTVYRSEAVRIFADASVSPCSSATSLTINWTESSGSIKSSSVNPQYFTVPANRLVIGRRYNLTVNATDDLRARAWGYATISVIESPLIVRIAGGDRVIGTGTSLSLDASGSYDPDAGTSSAATLSYSWSCIRGDTSFGKDCGVLSSVLVGTRPQVGRLDIGTYIFTVVGSKGTRSVSMSAIITVASGQPPLLTVSQKIYTATSAALTAKVNPSDKLTLQAWADFSNVTITSGTLNVTLAWSLAAGSLGGSASLASAARTTLAYDITLERLAAIGSRFVPFPLVLGENSLAGGVTYTFRLRARDNQQTSAVAFGEVTFTTNTPPTSGTLSVSPPRGVVLQTGFSLSMRDWTDDAEDYPLTYAFYYSFPSDPSGKETVLAFNSFNAFKTGVLLPQNPFSASENLTLRATVADRYNAASSRTVSVRVEAVSAADLASVAGNATTLIRSALKSFQVAQALQVIGAASSLVGDGSCTVASCTALQSSLLTYLGKAIDQQDVSATAVQQQAALLSSLTASSDALAAGDSSALAASLLDTVAGAGATAGISEAAATALGSVVDSLFATASDPTAEAADAVKAKLSSSVDNLARGLWATLEAGETPVTLQQPSFNVSTSVAFAYKLQNSTFGFSGTNTSLGLPPEGISGIFGLADSTSQISMSLASMGNVRNTSDTLSAPMVRLSVSFNGSASSSSGSSRRRQLAFRRRRRILAVGMSNSAPLDYTVRGFCVECVGDRVCGCVIVSLGVAWSSNR